MPVQSSIQRSVRRLVAGAVLMLPVPMALRAQAPVFIKDSPGQHYKYWYEQRAYPFDRIPAGALQKARREKEARWPSSKGRMSFGQAVGNGWTPIGPNNVNIFIASSGRLTAIAVHPTTPTTIFAGGAQGGVWKSINSGGSWTPVTDDMCSLAIGTIAIDQVDPNIIYAGTGELHNSADSYYGCGVLRSTDGGTNWQQMGASVFDITTPGGTLPAGGGTSISKIVIDRNSSGSQTGTIVFAATRVGVYRSPDSGANWTLLGNGIPAGGGNIVSDMVADTTAPGTFYAAIGNTFGSTNNGVYKTVDGGNSWVKQTTFPPANTIGRINIAISQSSPSVLYAAVENVQTSALLGIWKTVDGGANWAQVAASGASCASQCWYDQHIEVNPLGSDTVYYGGFSLYKSTNGGLSFTNIGGPIHVDHHSFAFDPVDPRIIYSGNDGGIYRSANGGGSWTTLNTDIAIHQFYPGFSLHPTIATRMMGGAQDNGTNEHNGTLSWLQIIGGDGGFTAIDHITGNTSWGETQWSPPAAGNPGGPRRRDGAAPAGFALKNNGISGDDNGAFIPPLVMDPVNPRVLYFGTSKVYRTRDNGESWSPISPTSTTFTIRAIAIAKTDTNVVYYGTSNGQVIVTPDAGATWITGTGLPNRFVTDIAVDPTNAAIAYATVSAFGTGHVYRTTDKGVSWTNISSNLPDIPTNAIVIQPGVEIDIGTDLGVFKTTNDGGSWAPFPGLPNVAVFDLAFNGATQLLVAATHGRGAFKYTVAQVLALRGDVTADGTVSALDAQAVLSATVGLSTPSSWKPSAPNGDANCDGTAPTAGDAQIILAFVVGLPVGGACVGKFQ